jgi:DNA-binding NtrC family response regulator
MLNILLVDDEPDLRVSLGQVLREEGHAVDVASDGEAAIARLAAQSFHLVVSDVRLPKVDGLTLLRRIRRDFPSTEVLLMTAYGSIGDAVSAMKDCAVDYLTKPFDINHLVDAIDRIDDRLRVRDELARTRAQEDSEPASGARLVGQCPGVVQLIDKIETIADTQAAVLLTGESGTGKELVARMLHERSARKDRPLVVVNCAAVPPSLIEAELFGHERGAFTGAVKKRDGRFKAADGGTIFLDEIGEMPHETQVKLLRVLQEGEVVPVGSNTSSKVDVRLISATNRDLKAMVAEGKFREDLYYRIKVFDLHLPTLRERRGDLPLLVEQFLHEFRPQASETSALSPAAWAALREYAFPGNVRELRHAIQHASILARGSEIDLAHLPPEISGRPAEAGEAATTQSLVAAMEQYEKELILRTIRGTGEKRQRAAKLLGISRKSLWKKLTKYGLQTRRAGGGGASSGN